MTTSASISKVFLIFLAALFLSATSGHPSAVEIPDQTTVDHNNFIHTETVPLRKSRNLPTPIPLPIPTCGTLNGVVCYRFATGCYCVIPTQKTWTMAYNYCANNGRSLVSIQSQAKQNDLQVNLPSIIGTNNIVAQVGVWTSGAYFPQLGQYFWSSQCQRQEAIVFPISNWQLGEPNSQNNAFFNCVRLIPSQSSVWADLDCNQYLPFICEF